MASKKYTDFLGLGRKDHGALDVDVEGCEVVVLWALQGCERPCCDGNGVGIHTAGDLQEVVVLFFCVNGSRGVAVNVLVSAGPHAKGGELCWCVPERAPLKK
jgi:hypothetical protein